jgi:hypothetical protein
MSAATGDDQDKRLKSKRFSSGRLMRWLMPLVFFLLAAGLLATLAIIILAVLGLTPGT